MKPITPCLWFDNNAEEAVNFYTSIFENSKVISVSRYSEAGPGEPGSVLTIVFEINGQEFMALNGGPQFKFSEAISFVINCDTQAEIDDYWQKLTAGGQEVQCGWLTDKFWLILADRTDHHGKAADRPRSGESAACVRSRAQDGQAGHRRADAGVRGRIICSSDASPHCGARGRLCLNPSTDWDEGQLERDNASITKKRNFSLSLASLRFYHQVPVLALTSSPHPFPSPRKGRGLRPKVGRGEGPGER